MKTQIETQDLEEAVENALDLVQYVATRYKERHQVTGWTERDIAAVVHLTDTTMKFLHLNALEGIEQSLFSLEELLRSQPLPMKDPSL